MKHHGQIITLQSLLSGQLSSEIIVSKILQTKPLLTGHLCLVAVATVWSS